MKTCSKCKQVKPATEFYSRQSRCKQCCKDQAREWASSNMERKLAINREWTARNHERKTMMLAASNAVYSAIEKGFLIRPEFCQLCGNPGRIEASHDDYSKPLDVQWLCQPCHREYDTSNPKSVRAMDNAAVLGGIATEVVTK